MPKLTYTIEILNIISEGMIINLIKQYVHEFLLSWTQNQRKKISFDLVTFLVALYLWTFLHSLVAKCSLTIWMKLPWWVPFLRVRRWGYGEVIKITVHVSKVYNEFITWVISTLYTHHKAPKTIISGPHIRDVLGRWGENPDEQELWICLSDYPDPVLGIYILS